MRELWCWSGIHGMETKRTAVLDLEDGNQDREEEENGAGVNVDLHGLLCLGRLAWRYEDEHEEGRGKGAVYVRTRQPTVAPQRAEGRERRTDGRDNGDLLAVLVLEAARDPVAVGRSGGHAADAREHEAGRHDERREHGDHAPRPARDEQETEEAHGERAERQRGAQREPEAPADRGAVRDRRRRVRGKLLREWFRVEATV
jgi:hypothetical protein